MARTRNSEEVRDAFASRLHEELDRAGFPVQGRGAELARRAGVTHTTSSGWLSGSVPALGVLVSLCDELGLDFTYLCTGERGSGEARGIDEEVFRQAVACVNKIVKEQGLLDDIGVDRLGILYMRAYLYEISGEEHDHIRQDVMLAAGR